MALVAVPLPIQLSCASWWTGVYPWTFGADPAHAQCTQQDQEARGGVPSVRKKMGIPEVAHPETSDKTRDFPHGP